MQRSVNPVGLWSRFFCDDSSLNFFATLCSKKNEDLDIMHDVLHERLKVGGNEKQWGSGRSQMLGSGLEPWRSRYTVFTI